MTPQQEAPKCRKLKNKSDGDVTHEQSARFRHTNDVVVLVQPLDLRWLPYFRIVIPNLYGNFVDKCCTPSTIGLKAARVHCPPCWELWFPVHTLDSASKLQDHAQKK